MIACPKQPRLRSRGYSLVELILVIAIMGVLSGIAIPRYGRGTNRYRADAAAKRVVAELQEAQQRARSASGPCTISFSTSTSIITVTNPTVGGVAGRTSTIRLNVPPYLSTIRSATFGSGSTLTFSGYGKPSNAGTIVVGAGTEQRTFTLSAVTGAAASN